MIKEIKPEEITTIDGKLLIKFGANWCTTCKTIDPFYQKYSNEYKDIIFTEMDADSNQNFVVDLGIRSLPTFAFYDSGNLIKIEVGLNPSTLKEKIKMF